MVGQRPARLSQAFTESTSRRTVLGWIGGGGLLVSAGLTRGPARADFQPAPSATPAIPTTPVGDQLTWVLAQLNGGAATLPVAEVSAHFAPEFLVGLPVPKTLAALQKLATDSGPFSFNGFAEPPTDTTAVALVATKTRELKTLSITVEAAAPHRITGLLLGAAVASGYTITDLGTLPGGTSSYATGINAAGQVVGASTQAGGVTRAFLWDRGRMTDLGTLPGGTGGYATGINTAGQVVGYADTPARAYNAFLWDHGQITELVTIAGSALSTAYAINDAGQIVGAVGVPGYPTSYAVMWDQGKVLPLSLGQTLDFAAAINDGGQVAGKANQYPPQNPQRDQHAFLWAGGNLTDLGTLVGGVESEAWAINAAGQVVGASSQADGSQHAVLWDRGNPTDLGTLGGRYAVATDINAAGQVVGTSNDPFQAFLWDHGHMTELSRWLPAGGDWTALAVSGGGSGLGPQFHHINDAGEIAGTGARGGAVHAFLMSPVYGMGGPTPGTPPP